MRLRSICGRVIVATAIGAALVLGVAAASPEVAAVLARFDEEQRSIRTLSANFTETTHSALLKQPIVARGQFFMSKPDRVRWEYTAPEEMRFVIAEDRYTGYFPAQRRAETRDVHRWSEQLFRFLGLGQTSAELAEFYEITLGPATSAAAATQLLVLEPRKKRVRKRMDAVRLWIDVASQLPVRVEYASKSGTTRTIEFSDFERNPDLAASLYSLEIPVGVPVSSGFSALSGFSASARD